MCKDLSPCHKIVQMQSLFTRSLTVNFALQVRRPLQSEGGLPLPGELVNLSGQHREHHRGQLWRKRKRLPGRQVNARNLQTSRNLWGGRSDNGGQVRRARSGLDKSTHLPVKQTAAASRGSSIKLDLACSWVAKSSQVYKRKCHFASEGDSCNRGAFNHLTQ